VVERVVHPRVPGDLLLADGRHPLPDDLAGVGGELQQAGPDDVRVGDQRQLHLEPVRHGDVVGVHPGDDVVLARGQPAVQGGPEASVARQRDERHRHRAAGAQLIEAFGEFRTHRPVPNDDHLVRPHGLVVDRAAERPAKVVGPVTVVDGNQKREGLMHKQNSPSLT
jgi:hypothetical protein